MQTAFPRPRFTVVNGQATITSIQIAEHFGKRHDTILRTIRKLECSPEFHARNFLVSEYTDIHKRPLPAYTITRDGATFLAMGFTGKEIAPQKESYIEAFHAIDAALHASFPGAPILPNVQAAAQFRNLAALAARINSLAVAVNIITTSGALPDGFQQKCVAAAIVDTLAELSAKLSESADSCADMNEKAALTEGGAA